MRYLMPIVALIVICGLIGLLGFYVFTNINREGDRELVDDLTQHLSKMAKCEAVLVFSDEIGLQWMFVARELCSTEELTVEKSYARLVAKHGRPPKNMKPLEWLNYLSPERASKYDELRVAAKEAAIIYGKQIRAYTKQHEHELLGNQQGIQKAYKENYDKFLTEFDSQASRFQNNQRQALRK